MCPPDHGTSRSVRAGWPGCRPRLAAALLDVLHGLVAFVTVDRRVPIPNEYAEIPI